MWWWLLYVRLHQATAPRAVFSIGIGITSGGSCVATCSHMEGDTALHVEAMSDSDGEKDVMTSRMEFSETEDRIDDDDDVEVRCGFFSDRRLPRLCAA